MNDQEQTKFPLHPPEETISICAYLIWEQEGRPEGRDKSHWVQAEEQLILCNGHNIVHATTRSGVPVLSEIEKRQN